jgi:hypothetical protein
MGASGVRHAASIEALAVVTQFEICCATDSLSAIASSLSFGVPICENFKQHPPSALGVTAQADRPAKIWPFPGCGPQKTHSDG